MKNTFWDKNKVLLLGLLPAIAVVLQQFVGQPEVDFKVVGFAALIAALSYFAKEWRGQGLSILGIVGTLSGAFVTIQQTGNFTWSQFALSALVAVISTAVPDPKSRGYENTEVIKEAKREGEIIQPASLTNKAK